MIAIITIPAVIYSGLPFFRSAITAIKNKRSNMDVPISVGTITAVLISIQETLYHSDYTYYDAAISLIFILLIGRYLDLKVRNQANAEACDLILSQPTSVTIIEDNKYKLIGIKKALPGQIALVTLGERIPIDGVVVEGESEVDNSIINGETMPVKVRAGSNVFAGSINISSVLKIKITKAGDNTTLNEIIKLVENAKQVKSQYINVADRVASFYTPVVFTVSAFTFFIWYFILAVPITKSLLYAIAVLIVTCPCALGLAIPTIAGVTQDIAILPMEVEEQKGMGLSAIVNGEEVRIVSRAWCGVESSIDNNITILRLGLSIKIV
ncbi:MAG: HAD-IC family P-type ATPase [Candidatus Midichloria mitochondrii]|nr:HAD-IC family P-type ATPase [Candidatus Midichloria mitochondrii]MDJ1288428.1 HAD-IC family P-type ATPase [Candidatus Midichloria mitochondrii]MDJ1299290.1 HAD-IC family P-type ATPase [Candidatus Midichloria mitochondrii]MDJ1312636.1 HAD-IC family P-type ATPase [Candidatus Midichloria mitochondrii]MDJ1583244.1 HAD-IC family P-type ATPase [Candidatus Midichloria mitochondrii]